MATLGEAYIAVRADLRPFTQELRDELQKVADDVEKQTRQAVKRGAGRQAGNQEGKDFASGFASRLDKGLRDTISKIGSVLAGVLDDGISRLPVPVKAALVAGLIAAIPSITSILGAAIAASVGIGVVGFGIALAAQYESVRDRFGDLGDEIRLDLVQAAAPLVDELLAGADRIEDRFESWRPLLGSIFTSASNMIDPLLEGTLNGVDRLLNSIDRAMPGIEGFVEEVGAGVETVLGAAGEAITIFASTGEDGKEAIRDLAGAMANLIVFTADLTAWFTRLYGAGQETWKYLNLVNYALSHLIPRYDANGGAIRGMVRANVDLEDSLAGTITMSDRMEKELRDLEKATRDLVDTEIDAVRNTIDFEESLDRIAEGLKRNGTDFRAENEKGRENLRNFLDALKQAQEGTVKLAESGKISAAEAATLYDQQIAKVKQLAVEAGLTETQFNEMWGRIVAASKLRLDAAAMGLTDISSELASSVEDAIRLEERLRNISRFRLPAAGTRRFAEYADGGMVHQPTQALIGEAGPEVVIPLTRPARAAQLMRQSGLDAMFSGGDTTIHVYIGEEPLEARMVRVVQANNNTQARALAYGGRSF